MFQPEHLYFEVKILKCLVRFQDAKRDDVSRRAYKLLATLHSECSELVKMLEETGANVRESRDLEDQVSLLSHPEHYPY